MLLLCLLFQIVQPDVDNDAVHKRGGVLQKNKICIDVDIFTGQTLLSPLCQRLYRTRFAMMSTFQVDVDNFSHLWHNLFEEAHILDVDRLRLKLER